MDDLLTYYTMYFFFAINYTLAYWQKNNMFIYPLMKKTKEKQIYWLFPTKLVQ